MALVLLDRVQESGTANTTVSFTLTGAVTGFQDFSAIGNGNTTFYAATDTTGNWEVGVGTYSTTGPTLTRTTILSSSNAGSAETFSGTVSVFVTYPSEQSVNLDASNNVTFPNNLYFTAGAVYTNSIPIYGGSFDGNQLQLTNGGGAQLNSLRDGFVTINTGTTGAIDKTITFDINGNVKFNNFVSGFTAITAAAGTTVLTVASTRTQVLVGSTTQTIQLPDATTLQLGQSFIFVNSSSGVLTITNNASATIDTVPAGGAAQIGATSIATNAGSWGIYSFLPGTYNFSTPTADFGNADIVNAEWQGTPIAYNYGGTGLTGFGSANYALYSTSSSALTAGTLPAAAGGTGLTSPGTAGNVLTSNGTSWTSAPIVTISADDAYFLSFMMG
jgi:hypothetical protein